jgi:hypothetical protein
MLVWTELLKYNRNLNVSIDFERDRYVTELYENFKMEILDVNNYICKNIIKDNLFVLSKNNYPYNIADNIEHSIIWFNPKVFSNRQHIIMDKGYLEKIINIKMKLYLKNGMDIEKYIYFMNSQGIQSVNGIYHIHLFTKKRML